MAKLTTEEFIKKAREVHGDKYDYSKVKYVDSKTKVCIICKEHGEFPQSPQKHLAGQGCDKCFRASLSKRYSLGRDKFVEKANVIYNGFYNYSEVEYINSQTPVKIICPIHGTFTQVPSSHLQGHGCPKCGIKKRTELRAKWNYQTCYEEAKKYKTKGEFQKGSAGAFKYACDNRLLGDFIWLEELKKPNGYWTKERCEAEARKYKTKGDFLKGCKSAHSAAVRNGWLNDYDWLVDQRVDDLY